MSAPVVSKYLRNFAIYAYLASLVLIPHETRSGLGEFGFVLLLLGWVSVFDMKSAWLANPLVIVCFFLMRSHPGIAFLLSILAIIAARDFATFESLGFDSSRDIYLGTIIGLNIGCYLWLASLILASIASATQWSYSNDNLINRTPSHLKLIIATAIIILSLVPLLVAKKIY